MIVYDTVKENVILSYLHPFQEDRYLALIPCVPSYQIRFCSHGPSLELPLHLLPPYSPALPLDVTAAVVVCSGRLRAVMPRCTVQA